MTAKFIIICLVISTSFQLWDAKTPSTQNWKKFSRSDRSKNINSSKNRNSSSINQNKYFSNLKPSKNHRKLIGDSGIHLLQKGFALTGDRGLFLGSLLGKLTGKEKKAEGGNPNQALLDQQTELSRKESYAVYQNQLLIGDKHYLNELYDLVDNVSKKVSLCEVRANVGMNSISSAVIKISRNPIQ